MKTYIIYLAAGNSRRFKEDKLHTLFKGKELYLYGIDTLKQLLKHRNDIEIIIVSNTIDIQEKCIYSYKSPLSERGISYSIKAALDHINQQKDYQMMFMVADQPYLSYQTLNKMIDVFNQSSYSICSLMFKDRVGNPVIFSKGYFNELYSLKEDQGGRKIVNKYPQECFYFIIENEKELYDIDYQSDLQKLIKEEKYD